MTLPFLGLATFLAFVYFEPSIWFPFVAEYRIALVVAIVTLILTLLSGGRIPQAIQNPLLLLLLASAAISTLFSLSPDNSYAHLVLLLKAGSLYFLMTMILSLPGNLVRSFYIILTYASLASFATLLAAKLGYFAPGYATPYRLVALLGGVGDGPNEFGAMMAAFFPIPIALLEGQKSLPKRALLLTVALSFLRCLTRTRSRGAFLGLLTTATIMLWEYRKRSGILLLLFLFAAFAFFNTHEAFWERISALESAETIQADAPAYDRLQQILFAIQLISLRPITGVGLDSFVRAKIDLLGLDPASTITQHVPHNAYLGIGAEIGLPAMLAFILLIAISIAQSYSSEALFKTRIDLFHLYRITKGIRLGLIGLAISILFLSEQYNSLLYQLIAFTVCLRHLAQQHTKPMTSGQKQSATSHA